jgi:hypothetical protein
MNEDLAALDYRRRLLFIGLFSNADDQGRLRGHPALISSKIFPYEIIPLDEIDAALQDLAEKGLIIRYQADGKAHIQMAAWWTHQRLQWAKPSELPAPDGWHDRIRVRRGTGVWTQGWPDAQDHTPCDKTPIQTPVETPVHITRTVTGIETGTGRIIEQSNSKARAPVDNSHPPPISDSPTAQESDLRESGQYLRSISVSLGDGDAIESNLTRVDNIWQATDLDEPAILDCMRHATAQVEKRKLRDPPINKAMPYWFTCFEQDVQAREREKERT